MTATDALNKIRAHALSDGLKRDADFDAHIDAALEQCDLVLDLLCEMRIKIWDLKNRK